MSFEPALLSAVAETRAENAELRKKLKEAEGRVGKPVDAEVKRLNSWLAEARAERDALKRQIEFGNDGRDAQIDQLRTELARKDTEIARLAADKVNIAGRLANALSALHRVGA